MPLEVPIAPWLRSNTDQVAEMYAQGVKSGVALAGERARLDSERAHNEMLAGLQANHLQQQYQAHLDTLHQHHLEQQAALAVRKAYNDEMIGIRQQDNDRKSGIARAQAEQAAQQFAARQKFSEMMKVPGTKLEDALYANPALLSTGTMTALTRGAANNRTYGEPIIKPIPGLPGAQMIYRPGSPGVHVTQPFRNTGALTQKQRADIEMSMNRLRRSKAEMTDDADIRDTDASIKRLQGILDANPATIAPTAPVPVPAPGAPAPAAAPAVSAQYPDGTVLRGKTGSANEGKRWIVLKGQLVPYTPPTEESVPAEGEEPSDEEEDQDQTDLYPGEEE